ncbi:MAG: nucleotidyltransferase family protein [Candidatus Bipolaricaulota bacterium]|nr:nucleotidyltransferase family protein [Candidatus Bipolaricaulota bacterium]
MITKIAVEAIVLAAGKGERMGAIKPLIVIDGQPILVRVITTLRTAGIGRVIVVLGYNAALIEKEVDLSRCIVANNTDYESGMGSSLSLGVSLLSSAATGFLVVHADMPYVKAETVSKVIARALEGAKIVAPVYKGVRGFPVYLDCGCREELLPTLRGEIGARNYISQHEDDLVLVEVDDPGVIIDIDRPQDIMGG